MDAANADFLAVRNQVWVLVAQARSNRFKLQHAMEGDLKAALEVLPKLFGTTLSVNVEWNDKESKFQKKKA